MGKIFQSGLVLGGIFLASVAVQSPALGAPIPFSTQKKSLSMVQIIQNYLTKNDVTVANEPDSRRKRVIRKRKEAYGKKSFLSIKKSAKFPQLPQQIIKTGSPVPYKGLTRALKEKF